MCFATETIKKLTKSDFFRKQKEFMMLGIPTWLLAIIQVGLAFITLVFAGHMGQAMLAGVGLGNTMYNVLLWSVLWGFSSAMDTFGPQVYACSVKKDHLGTVTLKILVQGLVVYIFILGIYLNSTHLVMLLPVENLVIPSLPDKSGENHGVASIKSLYKGYIFDGSNSMTHKNESLADVFLMSPPMNNLQITVRYMKLVSLVPLLDFFVSIISKYLIIQKYIIEVYVISLVMVVVHLVGNVLLVWWLEWGLMGLAMSALVTRVLTVVIILTYCWRKRNKLAWCGYTSAVCRNWGESIKLGLSGK